MSVRSPITERPDVKLLFEPTTDEDKFGATVYYTRPQFPPIGCLWSWEVYKHQPDGARKVLASGASTCETNCWTAVERFLQTGNVT